MTRIAPPGRLVVVTGASRGIGRAVALAFAEEGARVVIIHSADAERAAGVADEVRRLGGEPHVLDTDVSDPEAVRRMGDRVGELGVVDVLVNNAGICPFTDFFDITPELWDHVHAVNLRGVFLVTQTLTRQMVAAGRGGRVISMSSISAFTGGVQQAHYCPTKAGISALMKSLALSLGPKGITCNSIQPGVIETDINRDDLRSEAKRASLEERIPLGIGQPDDVAGLVWLLSQPGAGYLNGADIVCDGGLTVNPGT